MPNWSGIDYREGAKAWSARGELRSLLKSISRHVMLKTSLWCATCQRVEKVVDSFGTVVKLECSHRREIEDGLKARIAKLEREIEATAPTIEEEA